MLTDGYGELLELCLLPENALNADGGSILAEFPFFSYATGYTAEQ